MLQTLMRLLLFPHSTGQRTRCRDLRGLRSHQLTAAGVRREASLGISSLTHPIWPLRLGGPAVSPNSLWAHTYRSCPLAVSGPFSCSDDGGWGCTPRWLQSREPSGIWDRAGKCFTMAWDRRWEGGGTSQRQHPAHHWEM